MSAFEPRPKTERLWPWFVIPLVLLAAIAAALYYFGGNGGFSGAAYDVR